MAHAAVDGVSYRNLLTSSLEEQVDIEEVPSLSQVLETYGQQFPEETTKFFRFVSTSGSYGEGPFKEPIKFGQVKDVQSIVHLRPEIIDFAFAGKCWLFLRKALWSDWSSLILKVLEDHTDPLYCLVHHLFQYYEHSLVNTEDDMTKLCSLLAENGMLDLVKDMVDPFLFDKTQPRGWVLFDLVMFIHKCLLKVCSKDNLRTVLESVEKDQRFCCQYLTVLLAARFRQWKQISQILRGHRFHVLEGSDVVFLRAMRRRAWTCAAMILLNVMLSPGVSDTGYLLDIQTKAEIHIFGKSEFTTAVFKPFLRRTIRLQLFAVGALMAAWARKWNHARMLVGRLQHGITDSANILVLEELMRNLKFYTVYTWLQSMHLQNLGAKYADSLMWEAAVNCRHEQAKALVEHCLPWCKDRINIGQAAYHIILYCQLDLLRKFLASGMLQHVSDIDFALNCAIEMCSSTWPGDTSYRDHPRFKILLACLEAGCSHTLYKSTNFKLDVVVKYGLVPLLLLLFDSGCISRRTLQKIRLCHDLNRDVIPRERAKQMSTFLQEVEANPHSLKALCCFTVSRQLGCGPDRKLRGLGLGLPNHLTEQVLLLDVLYPLTFDSVR